MKSAFIELGLNTPLVDALTARGYQHPTPVQEQAIPVVLEGKDILATAQTGTGKTASFALPLLQLLSDRQALAGPGKHKRDHIYALILTPTRELAEQIDRNIKLYAATLNISSTAVYGGASIRAQRQRLKRRPAVIVATPGRLLDLLGKRALQLSDLEVLVLDEADRMLDMGFAQDVRKIIARTPERRQTLFFSATFSKDVQVLSESILVDPVRIQITPSVSVADNLSQSVFFVEQERKRELLVATLKKNQAMRVIIFTRTKYRADRLAKQLAQAGIAADAIHSNRPQGARRRILEEFDSGKIPVLVATDVVARGIDVKNISHVINYDLPEDPESYVHRTGRTARALQCGSALSFCSKTEVEALQKIELCIGQQLKVEKEHPFHSSIAQGLYKTKN